MRYHPTPRVQLIQSLLRDAGVTEHHTADAQLFRASARTPSWVAGSVWDILQQVSACCGQQTLGILEVNAGRGGLAIALARRARRAGLPCRIEACDPNAQALVAARFDAAEAQVDVGFFHHDVADGMVPLGFDVICCYLPSRPLDTHQQMQLLEHMNESASKMVIVSALERSDLAADRLADLADQVGMEHVRVTRRFPGRILLTSQCA